jgi:hypothetical protein
MEEEIMDAYLRLLREMPAPQPRSRFWIGDPDVASVVEDAIAEGSTLVVDWRSLLDAQSSTD